MRLAEPCRVTGLHYTVSDDGKSNTLAQVMLTLSDEDSPLFGREFEAELPPPTCGHAEFVVPRHRFDAAIQRCWSVGDRCQVHTSALLACAVLTG